MDMLLMAGTLPSGPSVAPPAPKPADLPACRDDERGLLVRHKVAWTLSPPKGVAGPKISVDSGGVFLTSERLYLSARSKKDTSGAIYEVSLRSILGERFNQPFFGSNSLSGVCDWAMARQGAPVAHQDASGWKWKVSFTTGGSAVWLQAFFAALQLNRRIPVCAEQVVEGRAVAVASAIPEAQVHVLQAQVAQQSTADRNDPSVLWVSATAYI